MELHDQFRVLVDQWTEHCQAMMMSSNPADSLRHPAVDGLVAMGTPAVPLILKHYAHDDLLPWEHVLQEITGVPMIQDPTDFDPAEVKAQWLAWGEPGRLSGDR